MIKNAKWIYNPHDIGSTAPTFKKSVSITKPVKRATLYVSALGIYRANICGDPVTDAILTPGYTSYDTRVQYQKYDVTRLLKSTTDISITVGNGWACSTMSSPDPNPEVKFSKHPTLIASLDIVFEDGERISVTTDESWQVYTSEITFSELYAGDTIDKTADIVCVGHAKQADVKKKLVSQISEYVKEQERLSPVELIVTPKGEKVIDFGQNLAGYVEVRICGKRGSRIRFTHAEVLDSAGNFYTENMRSAKNEVTYVLSGENDIFKPVFSFQGYRYIRIEEFPKDDIDLSCFTSVAIYTDMKRTGYFECGNEKINRLYQNIIWGQRSNYVDIPTDCPQRDERLGWTGDTQVFCRTGAINYNVKRFFEKWLGDVMIEQRDDGAIPSVVPRFRRGRSMGPATGWSDAACICPWEIYLAYGDKKLLARHFPMMKKWIGFMRSQGDNEFLWHGGKHYGDWLALDAGDGEYKGITSTDWLASAYFAYSTSLVIKAGHAIGEDVSSYEELYKNIIKTFHEVHMENGLPKEPVTQTNTAIALAFRLYRSEEERIALISKLKELLEKNDGLMTTGFLGTPALLHALSENGEAGMAYSLLCEERFPSWLYSVNHGATTIWEHWDGIRDDGTFWSSDMNSYNHYAYGAVYDWIFGAALGVRICDDGAAYSHVRIAPIPSEKLGYAKGSVKTAKGVLSSEWRIEGEKAYYKISLPSETLADITIDGKTVSVCGGTHEFESKI